MSTNSQYISVRETAQLLGVSERKVMDLIEEKKLIAYRIANQFLRLKKEDVLALKNTGAVSVETVQFTYSPRERIQDFFYYHNFYLITALVIALLIYVILTS